MLPFMIAGQTFYRAVGSGGAVVPPTFAYESFTSVTLPSVNFTKTILPGRIAVNPILHFVAIRCRLTALVLGLAQRHHDLVLIHPAITFCSLIAFFTGSGRRSIYWSDAECFSKSKMGVSMRRISADFTEGIGPGNTSSTRADWSEGQFAYFAERLKLCRHGSPHGHTNAPIPLKPPLISSRILFASILTLVI